METTTMDSDLTYYDANKQLMSNERVLDPIELNSKIADIIMWIKTEGIDYAMLLSNENRDYTVFSFTHRSYSDFETFAQDLFECLCNRGKVLTISYESNDTWEIWIRDESNENFVYYLFNYSDAVLEY